MAAAVTDAAHLTLPVELAGPEVNRRPGGAVPLTADGAAGDSLPRPGPERSSTDSSCLKLKGLPYSTTESQVISFFEGFEVKRVAFVYEPDGRPSGLAFAEFNTKEDATRALSKNGEYIGERYVRLLHVPRSEMEEQVRLGTLAIPGNAAKLRSRLMRAQRSTLQYLSGPLQLVPTVMPGARSLVVQPGAYSSTMTGQQLGMAGQQMGVDVMWHSPYQHGPAMALAQQFQGLNVGGGAQALARTAAPMQQQQALPPQQPIMGTLQPVPPLMAGAARGAIPNPTSATVKVRGLPYRSSPAEILSFFQGFQYLPDSLQIGLDSLGRPSGEAWLTFVSPHEALRTVRELNRHYLGTRYLELSMC